MPPSIDTAARRVASISSADFRRRRHSPTPSVSSIVAFGRVEPRGRAGERERCLPLLEIEVAVREAELLDLPDHRHERGVERFGGRGLVKPGTGLEPSPRELEHDHQPRTPVSRHNAGLEGEPVLAVHPGEVVDASCPGPSAPQRFRPFGSGVPLRGRNGTMPSRLRFVRPPQVASSQRRFSGVEHVGILGTLTIRLLPLEPSG
jgi:hypothetical protein